jgi:DNA end-binding protein Ku
MYSAVQDRDTHFHMLHASDHVRVREHMRTRADSDEGETHDDKPQTVDRSAARSGYVLDSGEVVILDRKELAQLAPKPARDIDVLRYVESSVLPLSAFARPYWLGPDGDSAAYFALAAALGDHIAISEWVSRGKHHYGALSAKDAHLMLVELRSADQWLDLASLGTPDDESALDAREISMAEQLIHGLDGEFDHTSFHDTYREQVHELVETKAQGGKITKRRAPARKPQERSLTAALSASLKALEPSAKPTKAAKSARRTSHSRERKSA